MLIRPVAVRADKSAATSKSQFRIIAGLDSCTIMVVGVFPLAKLGTLLLRQVSKPLANFVKERAKNNHLFRTYICMPPAQAYNWCEIKAKMWVMNLGKPINIPSLNEAMAIELGANLLGESIIFIIAAGVLYAEYMRQSHKEASKEEARKEELETLTYTIQELYFQAERQDTQLRELMRTVSDLESQVVTKPWTRGRKDSEPPSSPPSFPPSPPPLGPTSEGKDGGNHNKNSEDSRHDNGIVLKALAYLQMNDLIGQTQRYHTPTLS